MHVWRAAPLVDENYITNSPRAAAAVMPLVEIIRGIATSDAVRAQYMRSQCFHLLAGAVHLRWLHQALRVRLARAQLP
jgi:hypothetical protein